MILDKYVGMGKHEHYSHLDQAPRSVVIKVARSFIVMKSINFSKSPVLWKLSEIASVWWSRLGFSLPLFLWGISEISLHTFVHFLYFSGRFLKLHYTLGAMVLFEVMEQSHIPLWTGELGFLKQEPDCEINIIKTNTPHRSILRFKTCSPKGYLFIYLATFELG